MKNGAASRSAWPRPIAILLCLSWHDRWRWLRRKLHDALPGHVRIVSADRTVLERDLLPGFAADPRLASLLFVGCEWYTGGYAAMFEPRGERFSTIDFDPAKARFGAARHVVAPLQQVHRHFAPGSVDVVVCNGVYGFGIDERAELEAALRASCEILRPGGLLVLGWNDIAALAPFDPRGAAVAAGLVPSTAGPLGAERLLTDTPTRHTFDCYVKPAS